MLRSAALVATGLVLLTGCGASTIDGSKVEKNIVSGVKKQNGIDVTAKCPDSVKIKVGGTFTCDVSDAKGNSAKATVTMKDDQGNVTWKVG